MTPEIHDGPDESVHASSGAHVNQVSINLGGATLIIVVMLTAIIGACGVVIGLDISERKHQDQLIIQAHDAAQVQEREARMVEYYIHEVDGKLISAGFLKASQNFDNFKHQKEHEK